MRRGARLAVAAVALLACAWFALGIHQHDDVSAASAIAAPAPNSRPSAAAVRRADSLLDSAQVLNPDRSVAVTRAQVALAAGNARRARAILAPVVAAEPDNLAAWIEMVRASSRDRRERAIAFAHVLALAPPVGGRR